MFYQLDLTITCIVQLSYRSDDEFFLLYQKVLDEKMRGISRTHKPNLFLRMNGILEYRILEMGYVPPCFNTHFKVTICMQTKADMHLFYSRSNARSIKGTGSIKSKPYVLLPSISEDGVYSGFEFGTVHAEVRELEFTAEVEWPFSSIFKDDEPCKTTAQTTEDRSAI